MSLEQAKLLIERMKTDEAYRAKIMAVASGAERIQLAKAEGYDCTEAEINTVLAELGDAEVDGVAGGTAGFKPPEEAEGVPYPFFDKSKISTIAVTENATLVIKPA